MRGDGPLPGGPAHPERLRHFSCGGVLPAAGGGAVPGAEAGPGAGPAAGPESGGPFPGSDPGAAGA